MILLGHSLIVKIQRSYQVTNTSLLPRGLKKKCGSRRQIANIVRHILYKGSVGNNLATIKIINVTV